MTNAQGEGAWPRRESMARRGGRNQDWCWSGSGEWSWVQINRHLLYVSGEIPEGFRVR